jgi:hypothetical protein
LANYKPGLSCQIKFIQINFAEWILPGTFKYALWYIAENKIDLTGDAWYCNDKTGAAAYPSSVMLKIIIMGYKDGLNSSRRIDIACETSILFMSVSGDIQPDSWKNAWAYWIAVHANADDMWWERFDWQ